MNQTKLFFLLIVALAFASCGSDEPRYADPEAHEKTVQLNEQYGPLMVGTWHYENISDTQRYFSRGQQRREAQLPATDRHLRR